MFLLVPTGNPPSLRFGHPDVTAEGTIPPPRRKNTRARFSKGRACVRYRHNELEGGEGLSPSQPFAGSAKPVL